MKQQYRAGFSQRLDEINSTIDAELTRINAGKPRREDKLLSLQKRLKEAAAELARMLGMDV